MSSRTYVRDLVFRNILRFFRAGPQQRVSSLCSIEMTGSRFGLAYIELTLNSFDKMRSDRSRVAWYKSRRAGHEERILSKQNDLQGRKVDTPSKGIYIIEGKKVFVK